MTVLYTIVIHVDGADIDVALTKKPEATEAEVDAVFENAVESYPNGVREDSAVRQLVLKLTDRALADSWEN